MCQQATLKAVIGLIPGLYTNQPESAHILLSLLATSEYSQPTMAAKVHNPVSSLLFEEDKTNSYVEKAVFLTFVISAVKHVFSLMSLSSSQLQDIASRVEACIRDFVSELGNGAVLTNPWQNPNQCLTHLWALRMVVLIQSRCTVATAAEESYFIYRIVADIKDNLRLISPMSRKTMHPLCQEQLRIILNE